MKTLISIDFDYFCPEKSEWDLGHKESLLYLKMLWQTRGYLYNEMKTSGAEVGFWQWFKKQANLDAVDNLFVSDSHCYAYNLLNNVNRVILFDAHHDCWPMDGGKVKGNDIRCDNWVRRWLTESKRARRVTWVMPEWLEDGCYTVPGDLKGKVDVVRYSQGLDLGLNGSVVLHVCRSGCWVPPWLDGAFLGFLRGFRGTLDGVTVRLQDGEWDATKERWSADDLEACLESERQMAKMKAGIMQSSQLLNGMVEQRAK